jgi:hypothetical protein
MIQVEAAVVGSSRRGDAGALARGFGQPPAPQHLPGLEHQVEVRVGVVVLEQDESRHGSLQAADPLQPDIPRTKDGSRQADNLAYLGKAN